VVLYKCQRTVLYIHFPKSMSLGVKIQVQTKELTTGNLSNMSGGIELLNVFLSFLCCGGYYIYCMWSDFISLVVESVRVCLHFVHSLI